MNRTHEAENQPRYHAGPSHNETSPYEKLPEGLLHTTYLKRHLQLSTGTVEEIEFWRVAQRLAGSAWRAARKTAMSESRNHPMRLEQRKPAQYR